VTDFYALGTNPLLTLRVLRYGGHLGYLAGTLPRRVLSNLVLETLGRCGVIRFEHLQGSWYNPGPAPG